jgi:hypothetical protein
MWSSASKTLGRFMLPLQFQSLIRFLSDAEQMLSSNVGFPINRSGFISITAMQRVLAIIGTANR